MRRHLLAVLLLGVIVAGCYFPALHNGFVFDDNYQIVRNPMLRQGSWTELFQTDVWGYRSNGKTSMSNYYRPLQMVTYRGIERVFGLRPSAFHAVNILFHFLATLGAYLVVWQMRRRFDLAVVSASLFAVHPVHSEAVLWISALTELGCALFYFLSLYCFLRATTISAEPNVSDIAATPPKGKTGWWIAALVSFVASLLWKEMALTLPLVVVLAVFCFAPERLATRRLVRGISLASPFVAATAAYLALRLLVLGYFSNAYHWRLTRFELGANAAHLIAQYWGKLIIPIGLNGFYVFHPIHSVREWRLASAVGFVIVLGAAIVFWFRQHRLRSFAVAWVVVTLIPVLYVGGVGKNVFTDRYLYIPSLGFCLLLGLLITHLFTDAPFRYARPLAVAVLTVTALFYVEETLKRIPDWRDDYAFFSTTVKASPDSAAMHNAFAQVLLDREGDASAAEDEYRQAVELARAETPPDSSQLGSSYVGLANVYTQRGEYERALQAVDLGLSVNKSDWGLTDARAVALVHLGRLAEAREILLHVLEGRPNDEIALNWLGIIALNRNQYEEASSWFQREQKVLPNESGVYNNLGKAYEGLGQYEQAIQSLRRSVALNPLNPVFRTNLAMALEKDGRIDQCKEELRRVLAVEPEYGPARTALEQMEQKEKHDRR